MPFMPKSQGDASHLLVARTTRRRLIRLQKESVAEDLSTGLWPHSGLTRAVVGLQLGCTEDVTAGQLASTIYGKRCASYAFLEVNVCLFAKSVTACGTRRAA